MTIEFLHTMIRVSDIDATLRFFVDGLGLQEVSRVDNEAGRFTLVFLASPDDIERTGFDTSGSPLRSGLPMVELTYNWDPEDYDGGRNFGHLAFQVEDIYKTCQALMDAGVTINRPPRDGYMAFIRTPDNISIELLHTGDPLPPQEPWASMENTGSW